MLILHPEYVVDKQQHRKAVLLPVSEWVRVIAELEDLDDIRMFDTAKTGPQEAISFETAVREIQDGYGA